MKTTKELFLESFGTDINLENTNLDRNVQVSTIKNGLAISKNKFQIFFFRFNEETNTHEGIQVLDRIKFDNEMTYFGNPPHEYIETEEQYNEWLKEQRAPYQEMLKRIEMYCLALKLENNLKEKNKKTKTTKI